MKAKTLKQITLEVLADGKPHKKDEFYDAAVRNGYHYNSITPYLVKLVNSGVVNRTAPNHNLQYQLAEQKGALQ